MKQNVDAALLREMMMNAAKLLEKNKASVDALNVFPVPDGDTGTNMSLTLLSAVREMAASSANTVGEVAEAVARGALRGARGNSGVILSQLFRGFARGLSGQKEMNAKGLCDALSGGVQTAYKAVLKPKEGTILTVARVIAEETEKAAKREADVQALVGVMIHKGEEILAKTPDMLPVLKQAGVVDAGGKGLLVIYTGFLAALEGRQIDNIDIAFEFGSVDKQAEVAPHDLEFPYCTEIFIQNFHEGKTEQDIDAFREYLSTIGDCVLVVGDTSMTKVHVHTDDPGKVLSAGLGLGELANLKIDNMRYQHRNEIHEADELQPRKPRKKAAMVAVSLGEGLDRIFNDLGVDVLVSGGQTMNPSIGDLVTAIEQCHAETVYVLPNNSNIVLAAEQAAQTIDSCAVKVIKTKSIPQGISAAVIYQEDVDPSEMEKRMTRAAQQVKTGQVTVAVRDSSVNDIEIHKDDVIGMLDGQIIHAGSDMEEVAFELSKTMVGEDEGLITLYVGKDTPKEKAEALCEKLQASFEDCDVEMHSGDQPIYAYLISVE